MIDPIEIVKVLCPRVEENFNLPLITISQTIDLISKCKNSNSNGHDDLNNRFKKNVKLR